MESNFLTKDELINNLINGDNIDIRRNAAINISKLKDEFFIEPLIKSLSDNEDVAIFSVLGLVNIGKQAVPSLIKALNSENEQVRAYAIEILGELKAEEALDAILQIIEKDPSIWVKKTAIDTIKKFSSQKSIETLKNLLNSNNIFLLVSACISLHYSNFKDIDLVPLLLKKMIDANDSERNLIAWAIVEIADKTDLSKIHEWAKQLNNVKIIEKIKEIAKGIQIR